MVDSNGNFEWKIFFLLLENISNSESVKIASDRRVKIFTHLWLVMKNLPYFFNFALGKFGAKIMKIILFISTLFFFLSIFFTVNSYSQETSASEIEQLKQLYKRPTKIQFPHDAPYSLQAATLGKMLFFDPRLSKSQNMSCATCHNPSFGWETPVDKAIGNLNVPLKRHAPTVLNLAEAKQLMWDGRAKNLEEQAIGPITNPAEMGSNFSDIVEKLNSIKSYKKWFEQIYPTMGISKETILRSLATYERTIQSGIAPFDRWVNGQEDAIAEDAKHGFILFNGKLGCSNCHSGWSFTDHSLHDIGLQTNDVGRARIAPNDPDAMFAFKTSGLRNISARSPYMHNGSISSLIDVIDHYVSGGVERSSKSGFVTQMEVSEKEKKALVSFLESLSEENQDVQTPGLPSQ